MDRIAFQPPKPCFGLEQTHGNPACVGCPHKGDCAELMGNLVNRVDIDQVKFHFLPSVFEQKRQDSNDYDPDLPNIESVYVFCFEWVFDFELRGKVRDSHLNVLREHGAIIRERIRDTGTSVKLFLLTNMMAWKRSHPEARFSPKTLISDFATHQVKVLAKACQSSFGTFDVTALDAMMKSDLASKDFEAHLLNSEIVAGSWIVNYKLFHSGDLLNHFYAERETALNPYWLAIEPTYFEKILKPHLDHPEACESKVLRDHRWNVSQVLRRLKQQQRKAIAVFSARERIMPEAIERVLGQRGLHTEDFESENIPVVNALKFWVRLGGTIQHYEFLKFVDNYPSVFDAHFRRI